MIFHENHLSADDSHEIIMRYLLFLKKQQHVKGPTTVSYSVCQIVRAYGCDFV